MKSLLTLLLLRFDRRSILQKLPYPLQDIISSFQSHKSKHCTVIEQNPTSCLFGSRFAQNPVFLLAGALLFDEKIRQSAALFWIGLRDVEILCSRAVI
jgi:hypothetical protein